MRQNEIYMIRGTDYKQMAMELLDRLDLAADIGDRSKRVGIKPNLVVAKPASSGATTHPELVDGVLTYLKRHGFYNLTVLESAWVGESTASAARANGIQEVCRKHQVTFLDLQKDGHTVCHAAGMQLSVCSAVGKVDYLINMPVLKGHCQTMVTCALKNMKGLIPNAEKRRFHTLGLHRPIAHLNAAIHQDFILVDNICGDLDFEEGGNPVAMDRILGFKDPVLCDSFAAESMGYRPYEIEYIRLAENLGLGSTNTADAGMTDLSPQGMEAKDARPARRVKELAQYAQAKDACSACYGSLIYALDRLDGEGLLRSRPKGSLAVGQGYRGQKGEIGIGQCTGCFDRSVPGCPPKAVDIAQFLRREWKSGR